MAMIVQGRVLLQGEPQDTIEELRHKVWRKRVPPEALAEYRQRLNVLSSKLVGGLPQIHVYADSQPDEGFVAHEPNLEDVYFLRLRQSDASAAAQSGH
jgi:hypothetical protein